MDSKTCSCSSLMILLGVYCLSGSGFQSIFLTSIALIISSTAIFIQSRQTIKKELVLRSNDEHETTWALQSYKEEEEEEEDQNSVVTSEDSEVEWTCGLDEGSFSDEEDSLIEIAIPTGHYVAYKQQYMQRSNVMDPDEDNLIEIDISMGLIKCSSF